MELGFAVDQHMAHRLIGGDRLSELLALLGILPGVVDSGGGIAQRQCGDLDLLDIEPRADNPAPAVVPALFAADDILGRNLDIFEGHIAGGRAFHAHRILQLDRHARRIRRDHHNREILIPVRVGVALHDRVDVIGDVRTRTKPLGPVDRDRRAVALADGSCPDAGDVGADIGFRYPIGEQEFPRGELGQELLLLFGAADLLDIHAAIAGAHDERHGDGH